jgi:hypothetical protein
MTTREELHERIDDLPEHMLDRAKDVFEQLEREYRVADPQELIAAIRAAFGTASAEDYPHWATPEDVVEWVRAERAAWDRPSELRDVSAS